AAHAVLQLQETGKPVYKVKNVSLNALCELYDAPINPMKDQLKNVYRRDQRYWARRPLSRDMMLYAAADVLALVPQVYHAMGRLIQPGYQPLLMDLCDEQVYMHIKPSEVKQRKKQRKVETEVADLRQKLSSVQSRNIVLSNREIRLLRYLDLTEEEKEKLRGSYKVARKLDKLDKDRYSGFLSPRTPTSEPPSLTEHMQLMDEVLADGRMAKLEKIERLEAILSAAAVAVSSSHLDSSPGVHAQSLLRSSEDGLCCLCDCHHEAMASTAPPSSLSRRGGIGSEVACQTLSTGDIVITRIFFTEEEKDLEKTLLASPKREVRKETS
ncbi:unnamed protein product, partial [Timema podura]|nr:unnamed protein product [Timema podura]